MVRVLIVAKTHMSSGVCVGGLTRDTNRNVRLIPPGRFNQPFNTPFEVGQVWELDFHDVEEIIPPHVEGVVVTKQRLIGNVKNMREILMQRVHLWEGGTEQLFDGLLCLTGSSGYISESQGIPSCSTGYWIPDRPLTLYEREDNKIYYHIDRETNSRYPSTNSIKYVGFAEPIEQIPAGTLVRVSLARWWEPDGANEKRCYLQLSGWYL